jgi:inner membrane protein
LDNLTHTLTGVMLSRAGLERFTPRATLVLLLAVNAPDIDIASALGGSLNYLHYHRNITHSLILLPVLPLVCVLLVRFVFRQRLHWAGAYFVGLIGVASHLLLDLTNVYGVRLFAPFSDLWIHWDITSVIDFWIWGVLLIALFAPLLARLVNAEIGARAPAHGGASRGFAIAALGVFALYDGGRAVLHARALATLDSRIYGGSAPSRVAAFPQAASIFRWRGLAETPEAVTILMVDVREPFDPSAGPIYYKPEPAPALEVARKTPVFQEFLRFSLYPFWQLMPAGQVENATRVEALDLRFGDPQTPGFVATAIVNAQLQVVRAWFQFGRAAPR